MLHCSLEKFLHVCAKFRAGGLGRHRQVRERKRERDQSEIGMWGGGGGQEV